MHPKSLRLKLTGALLFLLFFAFFLTSVANAIRLIPEQKKQVIAIVKSTGTIAARPIVDTFLQHKETIGLKLPTAMRPLAQNLPHVEYFEIIDTKDALGKILYDSRSLKRSIVLETVSDPNTLRAIQSKKPTELAIGGENTVVAPYLDSNGIQVYSVRYHISFASLKRFSVTLTWQTILLALFYLGLSAALVSWLVSRLVTGPVDRIRADLNAIATGDLEHRIYLRNRDEFGLVAKSVNNLVESFSTTIRSLEEEKAWKNEFIVLASHNLRSPLTVIMSAVTSLKKDPSLSAENRKFVDYIYSRGKELHGLIENLLSISILKGNKLKLHREPFDLIPILQTLVKDQENRVKEKKISLSLEANVEKISINGDAQQLTQVIDNLVDNAIKFSNEGGTVTVSVDDASDHVTLRVKDNGPGIDNEMVSKLFDSFRRGSNPLSVEHKGAGLGLYYVKLAVESHDGEVAIHSEQGKGTEIVIQLPKMPLTPQAMQTPKE